MTVKLTSLPKNFQLPKSVAILTCNLFAFIFVAGLYLSKKTRIGGRQNHLLTKDHPRVILERVISVVITCFISVIIIWRLILNYEGFSEMESLLDQISIIFTLLGFNMPSSFHYIINLIFLPLSLSMILFFGPFYIKYLDRELPFQSYFNWKLNVFNYLTSLIGFRNVIFAPFTEEFVFRSCMVTLLALADLSHAKIVFLTPFIFGMAHLHHAWEYYVNHGRTKQAAKIGLFTSIFQFIFTSIFGWYAVFLFMRTGSFLPPFLSHCFGNIMGFPNVNLSNYPKTKKIFIIAAFILGMLSFGILLFPFTNPKLYGENSLYWEN
nr:12992_t:CDS:2 [Entrophospora candida]